MPTHRRGQLASPSESHIPLVANTTWQIQQACPLAGIQFFGPQRDPAVSAVVVISSGPLGKCLTVTIQVDDPTSQRNAGLDRTTDKTGAHVLAVSNIFLDTNQILRLGLNITFQWNAI
jgi:hypothetical protein